jgi:hypothetical protein
VAAKPHGVAISLLFRDEPLARQLADLLSPATIFVYSNGHLKLRACAL